MVSPSSSCRSACSSVGVPAATRALGVLASFLLLAGVANAASAQQDVPSSRQVLETFPVNGQPAPGVRQGYELSLAACKDAACAFEVRLLSGVGEPLAEGGAGVSVLGATALEWPASAAPAQPLDAPQPGTGPFLANTAASRVWSTGEEESTVTASASAVPVEPGKPSGARALLVTQMAGFDHPKRRHALYVASQGTLKTAWSRSEPQGPYVSQVIATPGHAPMYLSVFFSPDDDAADKVSAQRLAWDAKRQVFSEEPSLAAVQAVVAGSYPTVRAARAARAASACFAGYGVVDTWPGKGRVSHRYALIALAVAPEQANAEAARLGQCQPGLQARQHLLSRLSPRSSSNP